MLLFRLFMGSSWPVNIHSIKLMKTSLNLEKVISAITTLDILISDECSPPLTYFHGKILSSLFSYILNDKLDRNFDKYILKTFKLFITNKQKLDINLPQLYNYNKKDDGKLVNLIVNELTAFSGYDEYQDCKMNMENINMARPQLFNIFKNVNYVSIYASNEFFLSLFELLSLIEGTIVHTVEIRAGNWINKLWESSSETFVEIFTNKNYNITMNENDHWIIY